MFDRTSLRETTIAVALASITGYVDAIGFTRLFGVFPANQTGNVVLFGIGLGEPSFQDAWRPALSMGTFLVAVGVGMVLARHLPERRRMAMLTTIEAVALIGVATIAGDITGVTAPLGGAEGVVLLVLAAFAMGIQTDVVRKAAAISVWTTFTTGAMVRMAEEATDEVLHPHRSTPGGRRVLAVLGAVVGAYVAGAAAGTAVMDAWGYALWVPAIASVLLVAWLVVRAPVRA